MPAPLAVYIHWPFCKKKCPYCDFNSHVRDNVDHEAWAAAFEQEIAHFAKDLANRQVTSVFFGGGTPSLMMPKTIERCLKALQKQWSMADNCEVTLEANPTSSEADKFKAFKQAGINRLSIGVQSLDNKVLQFLGREHSAEEAIKVIEMASTIFARSSFDLIYGRPEQSPESWAKELRQALSFNPDHISVYQLTIEQGTEFFTRAKRGDFIMPNKDLEAHFYEVTQEILAEAGLPAYEISNHAKKGQESRHNLAYWRYEDYVGVGAGAHGRYKRQDGTRISTRAHKAPEVWLERVQQHGHSQVTEETITNEDAFEEMLMMGLRLISGVGFDDIYNKTGIHFTQKIDPRKLLQLSDEGYINYTDQHIQCTESGLKTLDSLLVYLLG